MHITHTYLRCNNNRRAHTHANAFDLLISLTPPLVDAVRLLLPYGIKAQQQCQTLRADVLGTWKGRTLICILGVLHARKSPAFYFGNILPLIGRHYTH